LYGRREVIIYKVVNKVNEKIYIGQDMYNNSKYLGSGKLLRKAIRKYGKQNFIKEVIDFAETKETLNEKEEILD
jgi:hypothetical protein